MLAAVEARPLESAHNLADAFQVSARALTGRASV